MMTNESLVICKGPHAGPCPYRVLRLLRKMAEQGAFSARVSAADVSRQIEKSGRGDEDLSCTAVAGKACPYGADKPAFNDLCELWAKGARLHRFIIRWAMRSRFYRSTSKAAGATGSSNRWEKAEQEVWGLAENSRFPAQRVSNTLVDPVPLPPERPQRNLGMESTLGFGAKQLPDFVVTGGLYSVLQIVYCPFLAATILQPHDHRRLLRSRYNQESGSGRRGL